MAADPDDTFSRLQDTVDAWATEVSQTSTALAEKLHLDIQRTRPLFRPSTNASPAALAEAPIPALDRHRSAPPNEFEERLSEAEQRAKTAEHDALRLMAELAFARERLHERNRAAQAAEQAWRDTAAQAEEAAQALGRAQIELDAVRHQLRGKEWALTKARNELELLRDGAGSSRAGSGGAVPGGNVPQTGVHALTRELEAARENERQARAAAESATQRAAGLEKEHARAQEVIQALNAQVNETAAHLRSTGKELENARAELGQRADDAGAAKQLDAERSRVAEVERAYESARARIAELERELAAAREDAEERLRQLREDYDTLAASHMTLRGELQAAQQAIVKRDLALANRQREPAPSPTEQTGEEAGGIGARMDDLAAVLAERSAALDELGAQAVGHEYLIQALKQELDAARQALQEHEMDYGLLAKALRSELNCLRKLAVERDFVIHQQGRELEALSRQEADRESAARDHEAVRSEMDALRAAIEEKDAALRSLRAEIASLRDRLAEPPAGLVQPLQVELEAKQAELDRSRDRINYLQKLLRDSALDNGVSSETSPQAAEDTLQSAAVQEGTGDYRDGRAYSFQTALASRPVGEADAAEPIELSRWQQHPELQREVEETFAVQFPWPLVVLGAVLAGGGLVAIGVALFVFG